MSDTKFAIWATVSGGAGHHEAWLKQDGKTQMFETEAAAQARAAELNKMMNNEYARARFAYTVRAL